MGHYPKFIAEYRVIDKNIIGKIIGNVSLFLLISSSFLFVLIFFFSDFIARYYNQPAISFLLKTYIFIVFFSVFSSFGISILAGFQNMKLLSKLNAILALIGIPITLVLVYYFSLPGAIFSLIINASISTLIYIILIPNLLKKEEIKINFSVDRELTKKIIRYAFPLFISGIAYTTFQWFGPTFLSIKGSFTDVGVYKVAYAVYAIVLFIPNAINFNLLPAVSNLSVSKPEQLSLFVSKLLKIIMFLVLPVILCAGLFSKEIILILFGNSYASAVSVTHILIISAFFVSLSAAMGAVLMGIRKTKPIMYIDVAFSISFISCSYYLITKYGILGLAATYLILYFLIIFIQLFFISKYIKLQYKLLSIPFIICVIFLITSYLITQFFAGIFFVALEILLILVAIIVEWKLLETEDRDMIFVMVEKIRSMF